jgi:ribosomal protein S18 acetylase RimI-like enzyme
VSALDPAALLAAYDAQLRRDDAPLPAGVTREQDGPLERFVGFSHGGFVGYRDLAGLDGAALDELIARQVTLFRDRGEAFEWKLHAHDLPADLADRLRTAGFEPEDTETIEIAPVATAAGDVVPPDGVALREVRARPELERIAQMEHAIWHDDRGWLADDLGAELASNPDGLTIFVAEAAGEVVSAGWIRFRAGTDFATLWGGGTLPAWRGRGIYRALVAQRANLAAARGFRYLQVDASNDSRPILERLGFVPVTTTTPFIWSP